MEVISCYFEIIVVQVWLFTDSFVLNVFLFVTVVRVYYVIEHERSGISSVSCKGLKEGSDDLAADLTVLAAF